MCRVGEILDACSAGVTNSTRIMLGTGPLIEQKHI